MTSSTVWRRGVPGAIFSIAARSCGSRRGSSSDGVRTKPRSSLSFSILCSFDGIESRADGLSHRLGLRDVEFATSRGARGDNSADQAQFRALLEPPLGLG